MTERDDPIRRRRSSAPKPRETIEELYGDVLAPKPIGLFDTDDAPTPPHRDAAFSELAEPAPPPGAYHRAAEGAPGGFKRSGRLDFPRMGGDLTPIVLSHGLITLLTLGIWRFWQVTAQRRSVWSHTKLAGEPFEYRGSGLEMFIGAAVATVILAAAMLVWQMALGWLGFAAPLGVAVPLPLIGVPLTIASLIAVLPLIELARFRARRYRLRRTRWRGIRFDMRGSGLGLVLRWALWTPVVIMTLGLAWPFLITMRERHMTDRTVWGNEPFFFRGSAWRLMPYWTALWLMVAAPAVIAGAHVWHAVESAALAEALFPDQPAAAETPDAAPPQIAPPADRAPLGPAPAAPPAGDTPVERVDPIAPSPAAPDIIAAPDLADAAVAALIPLRDRVIGATGPILAASPAKQQLVAIGWPLAVMVLWFGFRAMRIRMFINARRIAGARAHSTFDGGALIKAWLAVIGRSIWPGILVFVLVAVVMAILLASIDTDGRMLADPMALLFGAVADWRSQGLVLMALALNYGSIVLFGMWLTDVVWFRAFFHSLCAATRIEGLETLEHVRQRPAAAAADADGLADALDIDVGI